MAVRRGVRDGADAFAGGGPSGVRSSLRLAQLRESRDIGDAIHRRQVEVRRSTRMMIEVEEGRQVEMRRRLDVQRYAVRLRADRIMMEASARERRTRRLMLKRHAAEDRRLGVSCRPGM